MMPLFSACAVIGAIKLCRHMRSSGKSTPTPLQHAATGTPVAKSETRLLAFGAI